MATFDPDEMVQRFNERLHRTVEARLPGLAMLGDAEVNLDEGILTLRIDLRPPEQR